MADVTMNSPTIPNITPATNDLLLAWDASAAANGEFPISELTTLQAATFATLSGADFTGQVTTTSNFYSKDVDGGTGERLAVLLGRNNNASTPAPGVIAITRSGGGGSVRLYPDDSSIWRTITGSVTNSNYATGAVVGAQSSSLDQKDVVGDPLPVAAILALIAEGAAAVRRFQYKPSMWEDEFGNWQEGPRPYNGEEFSGVVVDYAPRYGTDKDDAHPAGKSLNGINATGDLLIAVAWLIEQNASLTARVEALEAA